MRKEIKILLAIAAIVIGVVFIGSNFYKKSEQAERKPSATGERKAGLAANDPRLIGQSSAKLGAATAPVTLVEFFDPECEACRAFNPSIKKILKDYEGKLRLVVRYMPLHNNSLLAAQAIEAAGEQGKYWQMQELLFERQRDWGEKREPQTALMEKYAAEIGLNMEQFRAALADNRFTPKIERDKSEGQSVGVRSTPTLFVNGRQLPGMDEQMLRSMIDEELRKQS